MNKQHQDDRPNDFELAQAVGDAGMSALELLRHFDGRYEAADVQRAIQGALNSGAISLGRHLRLYALRQAA